MQADSMALILGVILTTLAVFVFANDGQANDLFTSEAYVLKCDPMPEQGVKQTKPIKCEVVKK